MRYRAATPTGRRAAARIRKRWIIIGVMAWSQLSSISKSSHVLLLPSIVPARTTRAAVARHLLFIVSL